MGLRMDPVAWGLESNGLLLMFGDIKSTRLAFAKVLDAHKRIVTRVREGMATAAG